MTKKKKTITSRVSGIIQDQQTHHHQQHQDQGSIRRYIKIKTATAAKSTLMQ